MIESGRIEYNTERLRSSLDRVTPAVLALESRRKTEETLSLIAGSDPQPYQNWGQVTMGMGSMR